MLSLIHIYLVTAKVEVNLRSLPSVEDPDCVVVASLKNGQVVTRTGINRDVGWSRVEYNGQTLYLSLIHI